MQSWDTERSKPSSRLLFCFSAQDEWGNRKLTRIMWPVEMSMLEWAGSSLQDEMLLRAEGLMAGPASLNWDDTLLILEAVGSGRSVGGLTAIRCRQSSCGGGGGARHREISHCNFTNIYTCGPDSLWWTEGKMWVLWLCSYHHHKTSDVDDMNHNQEFQQFFFNVTSIKSINEVKGACRIVLVKICK